MTDLRFCFIALLTTGWTIYAPFTV